MKGKLVKKLGVMLWVIALGMPAWMSSGGPARAVPQQNGIPEEIQIGNYRVSFDGVAYHEDGTSTWTYTVAELPSAQDLSNWVLETPFCAPVLEAGPKPWEIVDPDPNALLSGVKWETKAKFEEGQFWVRLQTSGIVALTNVAVKGPDVAFGQIAGPSCIEAPPPEDPPDDPEDPPDDPPDDPPGEPPDEEPPTLVWEQPVAEGGVFDLQEGGSVNLLVSATDNVAVERVEFIRWEPDLGRYLPVATDTTAPYQVTVTSARLNPTWNQISAASFDAAGNQSDWKYIWIYVVTTDPLFNPPAGASLFIPLIIR
jgi:hypothetical protein